MVMMRPTITSKMLQSTCLARRRGYRKNHPVWGRLALIGWGLGGLMARDVGGGGRLIGGWVCMGCLLGAGWGWVGWTGKCWRPWANNKSQYRTNSHIWKSDCLNNNRNFMILRFLSDRWEQVRMGHFKQHIQIWIVHFCFPQILLLVHVKLFRICI